MNISPITLTFEDIIARLPVRNPKSHKGTYGKALLIAGSANYRGAASLCTEGALRTGAGIVTLASTEKVIGSVSARLPECCFLPCTENSHGAISRENIQHLCRASAESDAVLVGCGLGRTRNTASTVWAILGYSHTPIVLDADALTASIQGESFPKRHFGVPLILTPHPGEMAHIMKCSVADIEKNREEIALNFALKHDCTVVLKGHETIIATPENEIYKNSTGNPGLSRGGSGDILAGMITGFLAQGFCATDACCCAVYLHGLAADRTSLNRGQYGMLPHDIFEELGKIFAENQR